jgi:hypothetical protein
MRRAVSLHRGHKPRIVGLLALHLVACRKGLPRFEDSTLVPQHGKDLLEAMNVSVNDLGRKAEAVLLCRARGNRPVFISSRRFQLAVFCDG